MKFIFCFLLACVLPLMADSSIMGKILMRKAMKMQASPALDYDDQGIEIVTSYEDSTLAATTEAPKQDTTFRNTTTTVVTTEEPKQEQTTEKTHPKHSGGVTVARINWEGVKPYLIVSLFLFVVTISKLGFHHLDCLAKVVPESCLLVVLGTIVGAILFGANMNPDKFQLSSELFFNILLPPIILESAYSLHNRVFFHNLGTVLLYAVIGTILNTFLLGLIDWGLAMGGAMGDIDITLTQCLVFSALIAAVDPVAVLAIFQEIGVNNVLYFLVFGESLLNDAVTVVLYNTMNELQAMENVDGTQVGLGFAAFFAVSLGGLAIGIVVGIFTSFFTRFTHELKVVEPLAMFVLAYLSYILADLFEFSGIISIIGCGLVQAHYAFNNIAEDSLITVKNFAHTLASTMDSVIFMFLGMSLVSDHHVWHTGFCLWNVLLCLVLRFIVTYTLTFIANFVRVRKISKEEQFIMAYGGLRGAVAFSLVVMLDEEELVHKQLFVTTTLIIVICTVFIQGISIKPLVKLFRIGKSVDQIASMAREVNDHLTDNLMVSIEYIIGNKGHNHFREFLVYNDQKYLKKWLQRIPQTRDTAIIQMHRQVSVSEYLNKMGEDEKMVVEEDEAQV